jgi:hypothetical protein
MSDQSASPAHAREFAAVSAQAFAFAQGAGTFQALPGSLLPGDAARQEVPLDELGFFRLTAPSDIAEIQHLRAEIQLPACATSDPGFRAREKKETRKVSLGHSSGATSSSAP